MTGPRLSIITVTYNAEATLGKTLKSMSSLKFRDFEHLIVDGASKDGTHELVRKEGGAQTRLVSEKDKGIFDAMNKGIALAKGEFLWFLNAGDCVLDGSFLERLEWDRDFYFGGVLITRHGKEIKHVMPRPQAAIPVLSLFGQVACHQSMIVRKSKTVEYDLAFRFVSDYDWSIRILKQPGVRVERVPSYWVDYELDGFSTRNAEKCWDERIQVIRKHFGLWTVPVMRSRRAWFRLKERIKKGLGR
jgi:glycosyltransferase involved in cell wall biosynthesis